MRAGIIIQVTAWSVLILLLLSGCAGWDVVQAGIARNGAKVADESLESSEWAICQAPTMGAWMRRYGKDPEKMEAWLKLCGR